MKHIGIDFKSLSKLADPNALKALIECSNKMKAFTTDEERRKFIDDNGDAWSGIRPVLWMMGGCKCWYSEAEVLEGESEVEHFRPKKKVWATKPPHGGYWWRAFDWKNFRVAHPTVNKRRTDYLTQEPAGKGCYFPVKSGTKHAIQESEETQEVPLLLDPTVVSDCLLIRFDISSGCPTASSNLSGDPEIDWCHTRATETIDYYHLNEGTWNGKRFAIMAAVQDICDDLISSKKSGDIKYYEKSLKRLGEYFGHFSEFTSAAKQAVIERIPDRELRTELFQALS